MTWHEFVQCCTTAYTASTLVCTSQTLGRDGCNPCPYRMHSSHWQLLSVKTGSVPPHPLQKALSSPQWHLRVLCCSSERSEITPVAPLGHCSGRLPLSTVLILNCTIAAGGPCLFNFPFLALQTLGPSMRGTLHPLLQPCRRASSAMAALSQVWEEGNQGVLSIYLQYWLFHQLSFLHGFWVFFFTAT